MKGSPYIGEAIDAGFDHAQAIVVLLTPDGRRLKVARFPRLQKYGPGEVDEFLIDLRYPGLGVYSICMSFTYRTLTDEAQHTYETPPAERVVCEKD